MTLPVVLTHEAQADFDEAADWYEQRARLGAEFAARIREVLNRIGLMPESHAVVYQDIRRAVVRRFRYNISYRVRADRVEVIAVFRVRADRVEAIAVFHGHRDPSVWQARV